MKKLINYWIFIIGFLIQTEIILCDTPAKTILCNRGTNETYLTQSMEESFKIINVQISHRKFPSYNYQTTPISYNPYPLSPTWNMSFTLFVVAGKKGSEDIIDLKNEDGVVIIKFNLYYIGESLKLRVYCNSEEKLKNCAVIPIRSQKFIAVMLLVNNDNFAEIMTTEKDKQSFKFDVGIIQHFQNIEISLLTVGDNFESSSINNLMLSNKGYPESNYFGRVAYLGSIFTKSEWSTNDAKVVCNTLCGNDTLASIIGGDIFPGNPLRFLNSPLCNGNEDNIKKCKGFKNKESKQGGQAAAVHCLTNLEASDTFRLVNVAERTGVVYLSNVPVCMNKEYWKKNSEFICRLKYKIPYGDAVDIHQTAYNTFFITGLTCDWSDLLSKNNSCSSSVSRTCNNLVGIKCAKCDENNLLAILNIIKTEESLQMIISSIKEARNKLYTDCQKWNCEGSEHQYPDYCMVYNLINDMQTLINEGLGEQPKIKSSIQIFSFPIQFDILKHHFFEESFSKISRDIKTMSVKVASSIAEYFSQMAQFDLSIAASDLAYAMSMWESSKTKIVIKQNVFSDQLKLILNYAKSTFSLDISENALSMASKIVKLFNPLSWLSSFRLTSFLNTFRDITGILLTVSKLGLIYNKINESIFISLAIEKNIHSNLNSYIIISKIFKKAKIEGKLSLNGARSFLKEYDNFSPAIRKDQVAEYASVVEHILEKLCSYIEDQATASSTAFSALKNLTQCCPEAKSNLAVINALYEEMENQQSEVMTAFARSARLTLSEQAAKEISLTVSGTTGKVQSKVIELESLLMIKKKKVSLIENACNQLKYMNHGNEEIICTNLLNNLDNDIGPLIHSPRGKTSMCNCPNCHVKKGMFLIPVQLDGLEASMNLFNLNRLYDSITFQNNDTIFFKFPDLEWLRLNNWVSDFEIGPFFLQKLVMYLPPQSEKLHEYKLKIELVHTKLDNNDITFQESIKIENHITINPFHSHCKDAIDNPYSTKNADLGKICINIDGTINGLAFPSLVGSIWKITLQSKSPFRKFYSANNLFIKAEAEFCSKSFSDSLRALKGPNVNNSIITKTVSLPVVNKTIFDKKRLQRLTTKRVNKEKKSLCPENQFYDIMKGLDSTYDNFSEYTICKPCPPLSTPRLFGYFCEQCPKGFSKSTVGYYGCDPQTKTIKKYI